MVIAQGRVANSARHNRYRCGPFALQTRVRLVHTAILFVTDRSIRRLRRIERSISARVNARQAKGRRNSCLWSLGTESAPFKGDRKIFSQPQKIFPETEVGRSDRAMKRPFAAPRSARLAARATVDDAVRPRGNKRGQSPPRVTCGRSQTARRPLNEGAPAGERANLQPRPLTRRGSGDRVLQDPQERFARLSRLHQLLACRAVGKGHPQRLGGCRALPPARVRRAGTGPLAEDLQGIVAKGLTGVRARREGTPRSSRCSLRCPSTRSTRPPASPFA